MKKVVKVSPLHLEGVPDTTLKVLGVLPDPQEIPLPPNIQVSNSPETLIEDSGPEATDALDLGDPATLFSKLQLGMHMVRFSSVLTRTMN